MIKPRRVWRWKLRKWLRETWKGLRAPWPIVNECHSWHRDGHSCPQCDGSHVHRWVAWDGLPGAVRCRRCGGRKCDMDECRLIRHHLTPHLEAARR